MEDKPPTDPLLKTINRLLEVIVLLVVVILVMSYFMINGTPDFYNAEKKKNENRSLPIKEKNVLREKGPALKNPWKAPDTASLASHPDRKLILYGRDLIANTSKYLGPKGSVSHISNGMNCQNCHLDAGTKLLGNNYGAVFSTYPRYRERSGSVENIYKRVNDCLQRSLNGKPLDSNSKEMAAIKAYISWLGKDVPKGEKPEGSGIYKLTWLKRAASPDAGKFLYADKCQSCHMKNGEGVKNPDNITWQYPPLWGDHSYNKGAGILRLSNLAGYIKFNMPFGARVDSILLTDEEAWDIAAYVNQQSRPGLDLSKDWPEINKKPVDHPFGPYSDGFSEEQHAVGPFGPIKEFKEKGKEK